MLMRFGAGWRSCTKNSPSPWPFRTEYSPKDNRSVRYISPRWYHTLPKPGNSSYVKRGRSNLLRVAIGFGCVLSCSFVLHGLSSVSTATPTTPDIVSTSRLAPGRRTESEANRPDYRGTVGMSGTALSGHLGNLTAEQNARLQDMWLATLNVFGVHGLEDVDSNSLSDTAGSVEEGPVSRIANTQRPRTDTLDSTKKSKKRIPLFSRKQRADASDHDDVTKGSGHTVLPDNGTATSEVDDKYGQNKDFAHALASQSPENLRRTFWSMVKHDHPDGLLLRFLRARKWDVEKALVMLISTMHWRMQEMHVDDDIIRRGEGGAIEATKSANPATRKEAEDFLAQLRMGKSFLHGTDMEGRPMCFVRVRLHRQGEQSEASIERYTVFVIETARMLLAPPVETAVSEDLYKPRSIF